MVPRRLFAVGIAASAVVTLFGCNQETTGYQAMTVLGKGVVNDPRNKSLRFDILKFGLDRFCYEMTRRGAPLKLRDDQPVMGRFFADNCQSQVLDEEDRQSFVVQYSGKGYAWTNVSDRMGFKSAGLIEYAADFKLAEEAMYIYMRPRKIDATSFQTLLVESALAKTGLAMTGFDPNAAGRSIVKGQLQRGFTVIRYDESGDADFGLGIIAEGQRPFKPFKVSNTDKSILENSRTEVHQGQQDYLGGFEVKDDDQALYFTVSVDGADAVDLLLVQKATGDRMIDRYINTGGAAPMQAAPLLQDAATKGQLWKRYMTLPPGIYYLIVDNSGAAGRVTPSSAKGDDQAAKVDYVVMLGDAP